MKGLRKWILTTTGGGFLWLGGRLIGLAYRVSLPYLPKRVDQPVRRRVWVGAPGNGNGGDYGRPMGWS